MHLALPLALTLAAQAAAQDVSGTCVRDQMWSAEGATARLSGCTAPSEEPILTLRCMDGDVIAQAIVPLAPDLGEPAEATLMIDGRRETLSGLSDTFELAEADMLTGAPLSARTVERLASGRNGLLTAEGSVPFHLTGSRAAISAMLETCEETR